MAKLWVEKNPEKLGLNYDDPVAVNDEIPHNWWLVDDSCKYILSVLVHKDNKDLLMGPAKQPPGPMRAAVREKKGRDGEGEIGGEGTEANQGCTA